MRKKPGPKPKNGTAMSSTERRRAMIARQRAFLEENDLRLTQGLPVKAAYYELIKSYATAKGERVDTVFAGLLNKAIAEIFDNYHAKKFDREMEAFVKAARDGSLPQDYVIPQEELMGGQGEGEVESSVKQPLADEQGGTND